MMILFLTISNRTKYTYDLFGNRLTDNHLHRSVDSETYYYDTAQRFTKYERGTLGGSTTFYQGYTLDDLANWSSFNNNGSTESRTHNNVNELTVRGATSLTYDTNGNLTDDGNQKYVWDNLNRLIQVKDSGNNLIVDYYYNADYLRVEKHYAGGAKEQFYYCDAFVVEDQDGTQSLMREYMQGGQYIDEVIAVKTGGNYYYYMYDLRYNEYGFVDSTGTVVERARYDGYGKRTLLDASYATITTPAVDQYYSFTGQRLDSESGLQYYRARYFDNELGRFTNRDPIGFVDGLNLYRGYFVNNGVDPSGLEENVWWEGNPPTTNPENWPNNRNFANINVNDIVYKMIGDTYYKIDCTKSIEGAIKVMTFKTDSYWEQATTSLATDLNAWTGIVRQLVIDNAPLTPPSSFASSVANGLTASSLLENQRRRFFFLKINEYKCICLGTNDYRWRFQKTISKDKVAYDWISVGDHEAVLPNASQSAEALFLQLVSIAP